MKNQYCKELKKDEEIVNGSTMYTVGETGLGADWIMALTDEDGYPAASMITAAKADGFNWIAFCTGTGWNKPIKYVQKLRSLRFGWIT